MRLFARSLLLAATVALGVCVPAFAGTQTSSSAISGNVIGNCTAFTAAGPLAFASYDALAAADVTGSTSLTTRCTKGASTTFSVNGGSNYANANPSGDRAMKDGTGNYLAYQLYQDSGHTSAWPFSTSTGSGTNVSVTPLGNAAAMTLNLYGVIPHGQNAAVSNSYSDTVTVTVNF